MSHRSYCEILLLIGAWYCVILYSIMQTKNPHHNSVDSLDASIGKKAQISTKMSDSIVNTLL